MASFQEILAAKRASKAAENSMAQEAVVIAASPKATTLETAHAAVQTEQKAEKPLTFAEKLALKKKQEAEAKPAIQAPEAKAAVASSIAPQAIPLQALSNAAATHSVVATQIAAASEAENLRASYSEIAAKIDALEDMAPGNDLKSAMADLKKSLMQNPSACELMLDQDIGKMVIALRRMVGEAMVAAKESKSTKKPKASSLSKLSAEEVLAGLDDL